MEQKIPNSCFPVLDLGSNKKDGWGRGGKEIICSTNMCVYMCVCVTYIICIYSHTFYISYVIYSIHTYIYTISTSFSQFRFS